MKSAARRSPSPSNPTACGAVTASGIAPVRSFADRPVAGVRDQQRPAPVERDREGADDGDVAHHVLVGAREPERFAAVGSEYRQLLLREERDVEIARRAEGDSA